MNLHSLILAAVMVLSGWTLNPKWPAISFVGVQGMDPLDTDQTHNLLISLSPAYTRVSLDFTNGIISNQSRADALVVTNANLPSRVIVLLSGLTSNNVSNACAWAITTYSNKIWGIDAQSEPDGVGTVTDYVHWVTQVRGAINAAATKPKLCGPSLSTPVVNSGSWATNLYLLGAASNIDVWVGHDYFACPGNGQAGITNGAYIHPTTVDPNCFSNLACRIAQLQWYAALAGSPNPVGMEEYGLYFGDTNDAVQAATAFSTNQAFLIFHAPAGGGYTSAWQNRNADATWSAAMRLFMNQACGTPP